MRVVVDNGFDIWYNYTVDGIHGISVTKDGVTTDYVFRKNFRGDVTHIYKSNKYDGVTPVGLVLSATYKYDERGGDHGRTHFYGKISVYTLKPPLDVLPSTPARRFDRLSA